MTNLHKNLMQVSHLSFSCKFLVQVSCTSVMGLRCTDTSDPGQLGPVPNCLDISPLMWMCLTDISAPRKIPLHQGTVNNTVPAFDIIVRNLVSIRAVKTIF